METHALLAGRAPEELAQVMLLQERRIKEKEIELQTVQAQLQLTKEKTAQNERRCTNCDDPFQRGDTSPYPHYNALKPDEYKIWMGPTPFCLPCIKGEGAKFSCDKCQADGKVVKMTVDQMHKHADAPGRFFVPQHEIRRINDVVFLLVGDCVDVAERKLLAEAAIRAKIEEKEMKVNEKRRIDELNIFQGRSKTEAAEALASFRERQERAAATCPRKAPPRKRARVQPNPNLVDDQAAE